MWFRTVRMLAGLMVAALVMAACGGDDGGDAAGEAADTGAEATEAAADAAETATEEAATDTGDAGTESGTEAAAAGGWEPEFVDGVLQPLPDGYPDHEITIINRRDPGHRDYTHMQALLTSLEDESPVELVVEDHTGLQWKTWSVIQIMQEEEKCEGGYCMSPLSVGGGIGDLAVDPIERDLGLGMDDFNPITVIETHPYLLIQRADAPWGDTMEEFVTYAQENPGEVRYASNEVGSGHDIFATHLFSLFDIEVTKAPMPSQPEAATAVGAGAADVSLLGFAAFPAVESGRAEVLMVTGPEGMDTSLYGENVPTQHEFEEFSDQFWGVTLGWMAPPGTSDERVQWLNALLTAATDDEALLQREEQFNAIIDTWSVEETRDYAQRAYEFNNEIARELGLHWEQE